MKKVLLSVLVGAIGFLALCFMFPGDRKAQAVELCGDGQSLKAATGGSNGDQQYHDLACDHAKMQAGYDALYRQQHGH